MDFIKTLKRFERGILVSLFSLMVILFFLNVVAREVSSSLSSSLAWIEEAVRLMNLFLVFGGLGLALERGRHVGIDTLRNKLPRKFFVPLLKCVDFVGACFSVYLVYHGVGLVKFVLATGQKSPTLGLPMGWIYAAPVIGFSLLGLRFALSFFGRIDRFSLSNQH